MSTEVYRLVYFLKNNQHNKLTNDLCKRLTYANFNLNSIKMVLMNINQLYGKIILLY